MQASYLYYVLSEYLSRRLTRPQACLLSDAVSSLVCALSVRERGIVGENLRRALESPRTVRNLENIVYQVYRNFGRACVDLLYDGLRADSGFFNRTHLTHPEHLDEALRLGRGVIMISAHMGNWELGAMALAAKGYPVSIIVKDHEDERVARLFNDRRRQWGVKVISTGFSFRKCLKVLQKNEILGIMGDRLYGTSGEEVEFFGERTRLPRGPAALSLESRSPVLGCFMMPDAGRRNYELAITEIIHPAWFEGSEAVSSMTRSIAVCLEKMIRTRPFDWYPFTRIWEAS